VKRGGNWNNGADAGPFCANLNNGPTDTNNNIGFRCCNSSQSQINCLYGDDKQCKRTTSIQIQAEDFRNLLIPDSAQELQCGSKKVLDKLNIKIKTSG